MKKFLALLLALSLMVCAFCGSASAANSDDETHHVRLTYAEDMSVAPKGSTAVVAPVQSVPGPYSYTLPEGFTRPGFVFTGWKLDGGGVVYQPGDCIEVTQDISFCAQWTATHPFTDLVEGADYFYDVIDVYERGLMTGTSETTFSPEGTFTRAMLWTVLARMNDVETGGSPWYSKAQAWIVQAGVSDGTDPDRTVSRQELLTMLYRQAGSPSQYHATQVQLSGFPDADQVADWARDAMWWALESKILYDPQGSGELDPTRAVSRLEVAVSVARFCAMKGIAE